MINFANNSLEELPSDLFDNNHKLLEVNLRNNKFKELTISVSPEESIPMKDTYEFYYFRRYMLCKTFHD